MVIYEASDSFFFELTGSLGCTDGIKLTAVGRVYSAKVCTYETPAVLCNENSDAFYDEFFRLHAIQWYLKTSWEYAKLQSDSTILFGAVNRYELF